MTGTLLERLGREIGERWKAVEVIWSAPDEPREDMRLVSQVLSAEIEARLALATHEQAETATDALVQLLALSDLLTYLQPDRDEPRKDSIPSAVSRLVASLRVFLENAGATPAAALGVAGYFPSRPAKIAASTLLLQLRKAA